MTADVGANAPDFELESDAGTRIGLRDFDGEWLVLYFYPRDNTPGCTREAQEFTKAAARLRKLGARVAGVSRDSVKSHGSFRDKIAIGFPLLSDPKLTAHKSYGAWGEKLMYGKRIEGTLRTTFLIAPNGRIAEVWRNVRVDGHADAVIAALTAATTTGATGAARGTVKAKGPAARGARGAKVTKGNASKAGAAKAKASKAKERTRARRT
jgi:thioredoxin-dependent peroxiredoxin